MSNDELRETIERARTEGLAMIAAASDLVQLEEARVKALGRKSRMATARAALGSLPGEQKRELGRVVTQAQSQLETSLEERRASLEAAELADRWERERIDVTLPAAAPDPGYLHPLTKTIWEIVDIFVGLGYRVADGPEIELTKYNFDALNIQPQHPSRAQTDTFYVAGREDDVCLRVHTSPVQMRVLEAQQPPVYVVVPGRTYRRDTTDATHLPQFCQIEGLAVDEGITMGDLKGTLQAFTDAVFGGGLDIRLRPHYFPFTEPSAEVDVQCFACRGSGCRVCKGEGWIEILGAGMVHPFLLEWAGHDPERYTGFAFGLGVERVAALAHGVTDIRMFYENDLRFLKQFAGAV